MKALLKLINTNDDASKLLKICENNKCRVLHKKHGQELSKSIIREGGFSTNFGGYGSFSNLGLGDNFHGKWALEISNKKQFNKILVNLDSSIDKELVKKISNFIEKNEGEIVSKDKCNLLVKNEKRKVLPKKFKWERETESINEGSNNEDFIKVSIEELLTKFPSINPKPKKINKKLSNETKQNIKNLQKRDLDEIKNTIQKIESNQNEINSILSCVEVTENGELERGPQFKGTKPALSYSDIGLLELLSISEKDSKGYELRHEIKKLDITVQDIPVLEGFNNLEELSITLINKDELSKKDLSSFGEFKNLKTLNIKIDKSVSEEIRPNWGNKKAILTSLNGLKAARLEYFSAMDLGLSDIKSLIDCKQLLHLSLDQNEELEDIIPLQNCSKLKILNLNKTSIKTLTSLSKMTSLEVISISECNSLINLEGLENLNLKITDTNINHENKDFDESSLLMLESLKSLEHLPRLNSPILRIREINISNLKGLENSNHIEQLFIDSAPLLEDINALSEFKKLKKLDLGSLPKLKNYNVFSNLDSLETCLLGDMYGYSNENKSKEVDILPESWPKCLKFLKLSSSAISLGKLPDSLENIELKNCTNLKSLHSLKPCLKINQSRSENFYIENEIDLSSCTSLTNLKGLENKPHLKKIIISPFIKNLNSLKDYENLELVINFEKTLGIEEKNYISEELLKELSKLKNFKLVITQGWDAKPVEDISLVGSLKNVDTLEIRTYIEDLSFISSMENIKCIRVQPNDAIRDLKRAVFDTEGQIAKLKMKLLAS